MFMRHSIMTTYDEDNNNDYNNHVDNNNHNNYNKTTK